MNHPNLKENSDTMMTEKRGDSYGQHRRIAIVVADFNEFITGQLLQGALTALKDNQVSETNIAIIRVPGSFEIPLAAKFLARSGNHDGIICLGAVIKGETAHFEHVAFQAASGVAAVSLQSEIPIGFGVLTTFNTQQAIDRVDGTKEDTGYSTAVTVLKMINLIDAIRSDG